MVTTTGKKLTISHREMGAYGEVLGANERGVVRVRAQAGHALGLEELAADNARVALGRLEDGEVARGEMVGDDEAPAHILLLGRHQHTSKPQRLQ